MFKTFADVPTPIKPFYQEVTKSEPLLDENGEQVTEPVEQESTDENGNVITVTVQKPVFHDVVYVELKAKTETKSMEDVYRVIKLHKGQRDDVVKLFLSMVNVSIEWQFHDDYIKWYILLNYHKEVLAKVMQKTITPDDEQDQLKYIEQLKESIKQHKANEPQPPVTQTPEQWFFVNYNVLREAAYPTKEKQMELQFNDMMDGTVTWQEAIFAIRAQYPAPTKPIN